uniref:Uncharacterized protein n=1 Tax=viral metagenome TaxID=1070528 RepID=A0A6C0HYE9_9ZZZZ
MFTKLYLNTTDPTVSLLNVLKQNAGMIIVSVIFHTILYTVTFNLASFIFSGKILSQTINMRLIVSFLFIMFFGYIGRYYHVKDIYSAYSKNMEKTRNHLDKLYITWIFIG